MKILRLVGSLASIASFAALLAACSGSGSPSDIGSSTDSSMSIVAGTDNQTAVAGAAVPLAPGVKLVDSKGAPLSGIAVKFAVATGGGTIQSASVNTDSTGVASAGKWTLGASGGTQTLTATSGSLPVVTFKATATLTGAPTVTRQVVVTGLTNPWDLAFTPDGTMFYTQRGSGLYVRRTDGTTALLFKPADMVVQDQSGMLGVAVDPDWANNRQVYVMMSSTLGGASTANRVLRLVVNTTLTAIVTRTDIVTGLAYAGGHHSGGRVRFGPDGLLYITTGDNATGTIPQSPTILGGKVLRVDRDGVAALGNNPPAGFDARVFTYGHRNPQGLASRVLADGTTRMYSCEHGPSYSDEVTPLSAGGNGGWDPRPTSAGLCPDGTTNSYCGYNGTPMTDSKVYPGALQPAWSTGTVSKGMSGCGVVTGTVWRDWNNALIVATLSGQELEILTFDAAGTTASAIKFPNLPTARYRVALQGPDGNLYILTDGMSGGDEIWRLVPS
ncbi:PQQ-dependent sugar dehydrogenase [soil metagenome]